MVRSGQGECPMQGIPRRGKEVILEVRIDEGADIYVLPI